MNTHGTMKITELIDWLETQKTEYGDIPITVKNGPEMRERELNSLGVTVSQRGATHGIDPPYVTLDHFTTERQNVWIAREMPPAPAPWKPSVFSRFALSWAFPAVAVCVFVLGVLAVWIGRD